MGPPDANNTWRDEPILAVWGGVVLFFLAMFISVVVLVGAVQIEPRTAALIATPVSALMGLLGARVRPLRRFFGQFWFFG